MENSNAHYPSNRQVIHVLNKLQRETHYLYDKPVYEWDEYDLSNWKAIKRTYQNKVENGSKSNYELGGSISELTDNLDALETALEVATDEEEKSFYNEAILKIKEKIEQINNPVQLENAVITEDEAELDNKKYTDKWFFNDNYFKIYPENILGEQVIEKDRYGKEITMVKGTIENLNKIITDIGFLEATASNAPAETIIQPTLAELATKPENQALIKEAIEKGLKEKGEKSIRKAKKNNEISNDLGGPSYDIYSFKEVFSNPEYNGNISIEEVRAFLYYKRSIGQPLSKNWYDLAYEGVSNPIMEEKRSLNKWIESGLIFYYDGELLPAYLYLAENVYEKINKLVKVDESSENSGSDAEYIIKNYGKAVYDNQVEKLQEVYKQQLSKKLVIKGANAEDGLILVPNSKFAREFMINNLSDEEPFKWKLSGRAENLGKPDWLYSGFIKDWDKKEIPELSLQDAFCYWLVTKSGSIEFKKDVTYSEIIFYYVQGRYKQTPKDATDAEKAAWKAQEERTKAKTKEEGDRLFSYFLANELTNSDKSKIEMQWNYLYNSYVPIDYSKVPIAINIAKSIRGEKLDIRWEKREAIAMIFSEGSGGLAFDVGVGKTFSAIFTIEQFIIAGYSKRPFIVVPNQTYKQWLAEIKSVMPHRKINDLYNLGAEYRESLEDENGNIMPVEEGSLSVMTYEGFERIGFNEKTEGELIGELYDILNQGGADEQMSEKKKASFYQRLENIIGKSLKGTLLSIEELGFDYVTFDEAHALKKVFTTVKGEAEEDSKGKRQKQRVQYKINSGTPSDAGLKGFMIAQYIQKNNNYRNVLLLTATPFTNSPLEIFSMMSLVAYKKMADTDLNNLTNFFDNYIKTSTELVINAQLKPQYRQIVKGFNNLVSLQTFIRRFWNYKTGEDVNVPRPNKIVLPLVKEVVDGVIVTLSEDERILTYIPMTQKQSSLMDDIKQYAEGKLEESQLGSFNLVEGDSTEESKNDDDDVSVSESALSGDEKQGVKILKSMNFARNLALSPYLYEYSGLKNPNYVEYIESSPKLKYVVECIKSVKKYHEDRNEVISGQVIYMDRGIEYFKLIKDYLVNEIGYKSHEVGMMYSGMSGGKDAKETLQNAFLGRKYNKATKSYEALPDAERCKILIGSSTIKEGINLQTYSTVLYNCFLDWNPTDIIQLQGRIWRQGNQYANVRIVNPLMIDSMDIFMFQKIEEKTDRINSIWSSEKGKSVLKLEEINPSEIKAALIKDPYVLAEINLEEDKSKIADDISATESTIKRAEDIKGYVDTIDTRNEDLFEWVKKYRPSIANDTDLQTLINQAQRLLKNPTDENGLPIVERYNRDSYIRRGEAISPIDSVPYKQYWFDNLVLANKMLKKETAQFLQPRKIRIEEIDLYINSQKEKIKDLEKEKERLNSEEVIKIKADEIIEYRRINKIEIKSVSQLVKDFEKKNYLLSIKKTKEEIKPAVQEVMGCELLDEKGERRIDSEALAHLENCISKLPQTKELHIDENGQYTPERRQLHQAILQKFKANAACITRDEPIAILTGGSPGSGKSTFLKKYAPYLTSDKIYAIDADNVRATLPEYKGFNATATHSETKDLVNELLGSVGNPCKFDVIYDGTMNSTKNYLPLIKKLRDLGYKIFIVYLDNVPYEVVKERALNRYKKTGRYVPMEVIDDFFLRGKTALNELKSKVDGYMVVDASSTDYNVIEEGGNQLPKDRDYSVLGQPIPETKLEIKENIKENIKPKMSKEFIEKRIKALKLSLKAGTVTDKGYINKRIKGLELSLKMTPKFAEVGKEKVWEVVYFGEKNLSQKGSSKGNYKTWVVANSREEAIKKVKDDDEEFAELKSAKPTSLDVERYKYAKGGGIEEIKRIDDIISRRVEINKYLNDKYGRSRGKNKSEKEEIEALRKEYNLLGEEYHQLNKEYAKGGGVCKDSIYYSDSAENIWNSWTVEQREHFIDDHMGWQSFLSELDGEQYVEYNELIDRIKEELESHVNDVKYSKGGGVGKGYKVFNYTDNIFASDKTFSNRTKANNFIKEFRQRYEFQGYYRDNRMRKIDVKDIDLLAIPSDFNPYNKMANGGEFGNEVYIEFLNKDKGFKKEVKHFNSYEEAVKWAKENFEKFNPDMIKYKIAEGGGVEYSVGDIFVGQPNANYDESWQLFKPIVSYIINDNKEIVSIHNTPFDAISERDKFYPNYKLHFEVRPAEYYEKLADGGRIKDRIYYNESEKHEVDYAKKTNRVKKTYDKSSYSKGGRVKDQKYFNESEKHEVDYAKKTNRVKKTYKK